MKKILDVMPVGAPWGGPESVRFISCFASLVMYLEQYGDDAPVYCTDDFTLCRHCGKCSATVRQKKHEEIHHLYLTVSGLGCHTIWRGDHEAKCLEDMASVLSGNETIDRAMSFAGLSYRLSEDESEENLRREVVDSIDNHLPVLAYNVFGADWSIVTGYEDDGAALYGRYSPWDDPGGGPGAKDENGVFSKADWRHPGIRLLRITGKRNPEPDFADLFRYLAGVIRKPGTRDCVSGLAAYDACVAALSDDAFFRDAGEEELRKCYFFVHALIGALAEGRCFASFAFLNGFCGRIEGTCQITMMKAIGAYFMDTHNKCWGAWAAMGENHICKPEVYAENFRNSEVRDKVAEFIAEFKKNDVMVMQLLEDSNRVEWFRPS